MSSSCELQLLLETVEIHVIIKTHYRNWDGKTRQNNVQLVNQGSPDPIRFHTGNIEG